MGRACLDCSCRMGTRDGHERPGTVAGHIIVGRARRVGVGAAAASRSRG